MLLSSALLLLLELKFVVRRSFKFNELLFKFLDGRCQHFLELGLSCLELIGPSVVVIIHESSVGSFVSLSKFEPLVDLLEDLFLLDVEVTLHHTLETL